MGCFTAGGTVLAIGADLRWALRVDCTNPAPTTVQAWREIAAVECIRLIPILRHRPKSPNRRIRSSDFAVKPVGGTDGQRRAAPEGSNAVELPAAKEPILRRSRPSSETSPGSKGQFATH